ncbi:hypothetical protein [Butyrivibrio sp. AE3004]|nr:hypothetical protein [Butyrivibrio sp. AE3004]
MDNQNKRNDNENKGKSGIEYGAMALLSVLAVPVILLAGFLLDDKRKK